MPGKLYKHILYHVNGELHPTEDAWATICNVFVVADGVTHDTDDNGNYPKVSDSAHVAKLTVRLLSEYLSKRCNSLSDIKDAFIKTNQEVANYNKSTYRYELKETNGYDIGAATVAVGVILDNKLLYGVLADCVISVFSTDLVDHPTLIPHVDLSANYLDSHYKWSDKITRKLWRKEIRNNSFQTESGSIGYGALDGRDGFLPFLQLGEVDLFKGDLVCVYTDGFIKMLLNREFVKGLKETDFSDTAVSFITSTAKKLQQDQEKTGYFIHFE